MKKFLPALILAVVLAILCGGGLIAFKIHRYTSETVPNMYALEWVGGMVVDYLEQNDDQWPSSWDDLRPVYRQHVSAVGQPWSFDELKSRVEIRWDVDVDQVRTLTSPPDDLIVLRDGGPEHWAGHEPNELVYQYLTESSGSLNEDQ